MSEDQIRELLKRPTISVPAAGKLFGLGANAAYEAAKREDFPVIRLGRRLAVPTAALRRMLQLDEESSPT